MDFLTKFLQDQGYRNLKEIDGKWCGLKAMNYTIGLMVGLTAKGVERRYCYEHLEDALIALGKWDGKAHPSGPWVKLKGTYDGKPVDMLNPKMT